MIAGFQLSGRTNGNFRMCLSQIGQPNFVKNQSSETQPSFDFISHLPNDPLEKELLWNP